MPYLAQSVLASSFWLLITLSVKAGSLQAKAQHSTDELGRAQVTELADECTFCIYFTCSGFTGAS